MSDTDRKHRHSLAAAFVLRTERNPRIQLTCAAVVVGLGAWLRIPRIEWAIVLLCIGLVLTAETLNTAIERAVDHTSLERHPLAKQAKDLAAGAVLIAAGTAGVVGAVIFVPRLLAL
jgi:diacylglycerol kinase